MKIKKPELPNIIDGVFNDTKFICKLEYEFLNSGLNKLYEERYSQIAEYFDE